uniref:Uncharacterized protein n=1 Tax=Lepeophtheirus salmonis TaxID=72036 RepID=A0A0K2TV12_LEPSM
MRNPVLTSLLMNLLRMVLFLDLTRLFFLMVVSRLSLTPLKETVDSLLMFSLRLLQPQLLHHTQNMYLIRLKYNTLENIYLPFCLKYNNIFLKTRLIF